MAGTQVDEIDATLLKLKGIPDRPVWSEQFRESAVACQSIGAVRRRPRAWQCRLADAIAKVAMRLQCWPRFSEPE